MENPVFRNADVSRQQIVKSLIKILVDHPEATPGLFNSIKIESIDSYNVPFWRCHGSYSLTFSRPDNLYWDRSGQGNLKGEFVYNQLALKDDQIHAIQILDRCKEGDAPVKFDNTLFSDRPQTEGEILAATSAPDKEYFENKAYAAAKSREGLPNNYYAPELGVDFSSFRLLNYRILYYPFFVVKMKIQDRNVELLFNYECNWIGGELPWDNREILKNREAEQQGRELDLFLMIFPSVVSLFLLLIGSVIGYIAIIPSVWFGISRYKTYKKKLLASKMTETERKAALQIEADAFYKKTIV